MREGRIVRNCAMQREREREKRGKKNISNQEYVLAGSWQLLGSVGKEQEGKT